MNNICEIKETKPGPYGTIQFMAEVNQSPECRLEFGGYIGLAGDEIRVESVNNVTTETLAYFSTYLLTREKYVIQLVKEKHAGSK